MTLPPTARCEQAAYIAGWLQDRGCVSGLARVPAAALPIVPSSVRLPSAALLDAGSGLGAEAPAKYSGCPVFPMYQWWEAPAQLPREGGSVRVGVTVSLAAGGEVFVARSCMVRRVILRAQRTGRVAETECGGALVCRRATCASTSSSRTATS
jgi:hypothetical protein